MESSADKGKIRRTALIAGLAGLAFAILTLTAFEFYAHQAATAKLRELAANLARQALYTTPVDGEIRLPFPRTMSGTGGRITGVTPAIRQVAGTSTRLAEVTLSATWEPRFVLFSSRITHSLEVSERVVLVN